MIKKHRGQLSVSHACTLLHVSRSGYYIWEKREKAEGESPNLLGIKIAEIFRKSRNTFGTRRIKKALENEGIYTSRNTIKAKMYEYGLIPKAARKYRATTNSNHSLPVSPNFLNQDFKVAEKNSVWVGDFTYIWTNEGWMYLAVVLDLFSRRVIGWSLKNRMTRELVIEAMEMAIRQRKPPKGLISHSDRGSQYCSNDYQRLLKRHGILSSMSKKGDCYDNACAESFFHSFKVEWIYDEPLITKEQLKDSVMEYIEVFYNRQRLHSYIGYKTPCEYEEAA